MKLSLLSLSLLKMVDAKKIQNINIPTCRNCIHYKPSFLNEFSSDLNKCEFFGEKNILTGKIKYDYADLCRKNEDKCGHIGKYFEEEPNIELKIIKHSLINITPINLLIVLLIFEIVLINNS
jgi:hypothetical protein